MPYYTSKCITDAALLSVMVALKNLSYHKWYRSMPKYSSVNQDAYWLLKSSYEKVSQCVCRELANAVIDYEVMLDVCDDIYQVSIRVTKQTVNKIISPHDLRNDFNYVLDIMFEKVSKPIGGRSECLKDAYLIAAKLFRNDIMCEVLSDYK